jgi:hypothetical protein
MTPDVPTVVKQPSLFDEPIPSEHLNEKETQRALDDLFHGARKFRSSSEYRDLIGFIVRFRFYSPFNAMLIHIQMPGARYVATPKRWYMKYGHTIKENARPILILQPKGPVMFVFDVADTEAGPHAIKLPLEVEDPFGVRSGRVDSKTFDKIVENAKRDGIQILCHHEGSQQGGSIQPVYHDPPRFMELEGRDPQKKRISVPVRYVVLLNETMRRESQFATIVHELAHLYCGHLGTPNANWWPDRPGVPINVREFEAESVSFLVCGRMDIETRSREYLSGYFSQNLKIPDISLECVMKSAGLIEQMTRHILNPRKDRE